MNINKINKSFNSDSENIMSNFIQEIRINEELQKMNKEVSFNDFKIFIDNIFKNYPEYTKFNVEQELKEYNSLIEPNTNNKNYTPFNKTSYSYVNKAKNVLFMICPTTGNAKSICNIVCFIILNYNNEHAKTEETFNISFANELDDIKDKLEYKIFTYSNIPDYNFIKFKDLKLEFNWFAYTNLKLLTEDCYKLNKCKLKNCPNCNKCKNFYPIINYTKNMYNYNEKVNKFIEKLCKDTNHRVKINQEKTFISYKIGKLTFKFKFSSRKDINKSSSSIIVYSTNNHKDTKYLEYTNIKANYGKEMLTTFNQFKKDFNKNKKSILTNI